MKDKEKGHTRQLRGLPSSMRGGLHRMKKTTLDFWLPYPLPQGWLRGIVFVQRATAVQHEIAACVQVAVEPIANAAHVRCDTMSKVTTLGRADTAGRR